MESAIEVLSVRLMLTLQTGSIAGLAEYLFVHSHLAMSPDTLVARFPLAAVHIEFVGDVTVIQRKAHFYFSPPRHPKMERAASKVSLIAKS